MSEDNNHYAILVEFDLKPGVREAFMPLILENAQKSLSEEPGCLVFDVLSRADDNQRVVLYEIYRDKNAFNDHLQAPHFLDFDSAVSPLVSHKRVTELKIESPISSTK